MDNGMRRRQSKTGTTLVELIVAMALMAMFAVACVMLIMPVSQVYRNTLAQDRAQLVADTVVDTLRAECSKALITDTGDVWIAKLDNYNGEVMTDVNLSMTDGNVLVFRRNNSYCDTIASTPSYTIAGPGEEIYEYILENDVADSEYKGTDGTPSAVFSRSIYNMDPYDREAGIIHYGYFKNVPVEISADNGTKYNYVCPQQYFDFTNPYSKSTYQDYSVKLYFNNLIFDSNNIPVCVLCSVEILDSDYKVVYTRNAVLAF